MIHRFIGRTLLIFTNGVMLLSVGIGLPSWQFWVMTFWGLLFAESWIWVNRAPPVIQAQTKEKR